MTTRASKPVGLLNFERRAGLSAAALGLLHALLWILIFPPVGWWPLTLFAVAPLLVLVLRAGEAGMRPLRAAIVVWLTALPAWAFHERWLIDVTVPGYPLLAMYLSLQQALVVWAGVRLRQRAWKGADGRTRNARTLASLALLWAGVEALRGAVVWDGYPWFYIGHPMINMPGLRGLASIIGAFGVSALVGACSALVAGLIPMRAGRPWTRLQVGAIAVALLALALAGWWLERSARSAMASWPTVRAGIVQSAVPQSNRMNWTLEQRVEDFRDLARLTAEASANGAELILWPETMYPGLGLNEDARAAEAELGTGFDDALLRIQSAAGVPMIVGAMARENVRLVPQEDGYLTIEQDASFNSAYVVAGGDILDRRYDKVHLTPFGEVMPYISWSEWLERRLLAIGAPGMSFDLSEGGEAIAVEVPLDERTLKIATPICFEATNPAVVRALIVRDGYRAAGLIAHLTNDGWFTRWSGGREQHFLLTRWRAIETRTPAARVANTGISGAIDATGRVLARIGVDEWRALVVDIPYNDGAGVTLFMRAGWTLQWILLAGGLALLGWAALAKEQERAAPKPTEKGGASEPERSSGGSNA